MAYLSYEVLKDDLRRSRLENQKLIEARGRAEREFAKRWLELEEKNNTLVSLLKKAAEQMAWECDGNAPEYCMKSCSYDECEVKALILEIEEKAKAAL